MFEQTEESDLIKLAVSGNHSAFAELVKRYESPIRSCLRVRLSNIHEAEDLAQETFILAFNKLSQFDIGTSFGAWLRGIAINLLRNYQRKHKALAVGGNAELDDLINAQIEQDFNPDIETTHLDLLRLCLAKLNTDMRTLLMEHFSSGYSLTELCKKYQIAHSTMTMRMFRLRQKLKECVENKMSA